MKQLSLFPLCVTALSLVAVPCFLSSTGIETRLEFAFKNI
jgi:hypothetical protein